MRSCAPGQPTGDAALPQAPLNVDFVTDVVCPWCYVGLHSLLRARERLPDAGIALRARPYQLNPDTPMEGVDRAAYYARKFPDQKALAVMRQRIAEAAEAAGAPFDPARPTRLPNTLTAHLAILAARLAGRQEGFMVALYDAYWHHDADIGDADTLVRIGAECGMDERLLGAQLSSKDMLHAVAQEANAFRTAGVSGVPTFIINERTGFSGALPPDQLATALLQARDASIPQ